MSYLKIIIRGNIGSDATVNEVGGQYVINFSVAHTEKVNGQDQTTWVKCAYWRTQQQGTGIAQYLTKGQSVLVEGKPKVATFQRQDGSFGANLEMTAYTIDLCGGSQQQQQGGYAPQAQTPPSDHAQHYQGVQQRAQAQVFNQQPAQSGPFASQQQPAYTGNTKTSSASPKDDLPF